jgi:hypothetical protein
LTEVNRIIESYQRQGYTLTLRQLYYQLVSKAIIPNKLAEYSKLSTLLKEGRMAGSVDWDAIEDRLRQPSKPPEWESPADIIAACIKQYRVPRMKGQANYLEVWVEKDALSGVLKRVTSEYGIPIVVNRGYSSVTAMYDAHQRFSLADSEGADEIRVIYIGDFDPSGQDMIRDITDRIEEFNNGDYSFEILPVALTLDQINAYSPPPNPAKITDPRADKYIAKYGPTSWEVDALPPEVLNSILTNVIDALIDREVYDDVIATEEGHIKKLKKVKEKL